MNQFVVSARLSPPVEALCDRLRYAEYAIPPLPRPLPDPLGHSRLVLHKLANELGRKLPYMGKFGDCEMPLFEVTRMFRPGHALLPKTRGSFG